MGREGCCSIVGLHCDELFHAFWKCILSCRAMVCRGRSTICGWGGWSFGGRGGVVSVRVAMIGSACVVGEVSCLFGQVVFGMKKVCLNLCYGEED